MSQAPNIDGVLIQWGDRLFYPGNRIVRVRRNPSSRPVRASAPQPSASASKPPWSAGRHR